MTVQVLTESDLRGLVGLGDDERAAVEAVFPLVSAGHGSQPPVQRIDVPEHRGEIDVKSAYLPGYDGIAVKISAGYFDNPSLGLPSLGGLMVVLDTRTGVPRAALLDNGYLTDLRTALAGAVAAHHLARADATTVGVLGAGLQARAQVEALTLVRPLAQVRVWARRPEAAADFAADVTSALGLPAVAVDTPADAVVAGGLLVTTTPATQPLVDAACLRPGLHVTAVGSDAEHKHELGPEVVLAADVVVCDQRGQSARLGELRAAVGAGFDLADAAELGEVIAGDAPGRTDDDQVTLCDLTGTGAQDTAIATLALARARSRGVGTTIET